MNSTNNNIIPQGYKMTELGALPEEWEVVKLGEVADISSGGNAPQGDKYFNGDKPFVRVSHIDNQNYSVNKYDLINDNAINDYRLKLFPKDTIIFPKSGATVYLEKRAMLPIDAYVVSHLCTVISNKEEAIQHFLFYVLISLKLAKEKADGYPTLNISEVKQIPIPLPPLAEQQKIAAVLSAVQEAKEKTEAVINATKKLKKSMMKHLFTYGPVSLQEAENIPLKETEIGLVPEDWDVVKLKKVFKDISKERIILINEEKKYKQLTVKLYSKGIQLRKINFGSKIGVKKQYHVSTGDFVFSKIDARNGAYGFIPEELNDGIVSGDFPILKLNREMCDQQFLSYYLSIEKNWIYLRNFAVGTTNRKRIQPKEFLSYLSIPLPPLHVQQKIASILSTIDEKIQAEEAKKKALEDLFRSLLNNLMSGKIRVNHLNIA